MRRTVTEDTVRRAISFYRSLDITARDFERRCNLPQASLSKAINNNKMSEDTAWRILRAYPALSEKWLFDGVGDMLTDPIEQQEVTKVAKQPATGSADEALMRALYERLLQAKDDQLQAKTDEIDRLRDEIDHLRAMVDGTTKTA